MPDDVRDLLEGVDAPPMQVDPEAVVAGGRRRHRRRARAGTGVLVVAVAALALGAAAVRDTGHRAAPPASSSSTTASKPSTDVSVPRPVRARVVLDVGHCWVKDVVFDGRTWGLTQQEQLGTGGGMPSSWQGAGVMELLSADKARYIDDGGKVLTFLPIEDPTVFRPRVCI